MSQSIATEAVVGYDDAKRYERHRPSYPPEVTQKLLDLLGNKPESPPRVVELGAGTGIFTESLASRPEILEITAVEPHKQMRAVLQGKNLNRVRVIDGLASKMDVPSGWADVVVAATAFHWFATRATIEEIHRVLKPGGLLFLLWGYTDYNPIGRMPSKTKWGKELYECILPFWKRQNENEKWESVFYDSPASHPDASNPNTTRQLFVTPLQKENIDWTEQVSRSAIWDRLSTSSSIASRDEAEIQAIKKSVENILTSDSIEASKDGLITVPMGTHLEWTTSIVL